VPQNARHIGAHRHLKETWIVETRGLAVSAVGAGATRILR
jgi:hypothetical protein